MTKRTSLLCEAVNKNRTLILDAEHYIWTHPETGYTEWGTSNYLKEKFEALGYTPVCAGDIPGFYADADTGRPGPCLLVCAELDALIMPAHPDAVNGKVHACGHHAQCSALLGLAAALKEPGVLDGLSGKIRLMAVPAEESEELPMRRALRDAGTIRFLSGKLEFMARGFMDGVDLGMMFHTIGRDAEFSCDCLGANGLLRKEITVRGKFSHGARADLGINELNAAMLALQSVNDLREAFREEDHLTYSQTITSHDQPNAEVHISLNVRGGSLEIIRTASEKFSRAFAACAASLGATVEIRDSYGYAPMLPDPAFGAVAKECAEELVGAERVDFRQAWNKGCTDMGELSTLIPCIHPYACGAKGATHSCEFRIDPERACINSAKVQLMIADRLLSDGGSLASGICRDFRPAFGSIAEYLAYVDTFTRQARSFVTEQDGCFTLTLAQS